MKNSVLMRSINTLSFRKKLNNLRVTCECLPKNKNLSSAVLNLSTSFKYFNNCQPSNEGYVRRLFNVHLFTSYSPVRV
jgi:hypothetical protein